MLNQEHDDDDMDFDLQSRHKESKMVKVADIDHWLLGKNGKHLYKEAFFCPQCQAMRQLKRPLVFRFKRAYCDGTRQYRKTFWSVLVDIFSIVADVFLP